jgi:hypothetical protein
MRFIISLICILLPNLTFAEPADIRDNAPDRHIVVKGDTLWDISATFFKDPWKWQKIWGLNKDTIKNPHWIYPGDVVLLDRASGTLHIGDTLQPPPSANSTADNISGDVAVTSNIPVSAPNNIGVIKLSPHVRELSSNHDAIPLIPLSAIAPFLTNPLVVDDVNISSFPTLIGAYEHRTLLGTHDLAYVSNMPKDKGTQWQVYRLGKTFVDPVSEEVLGHEVVYLGDATVEKFAPVSELRITKVVAEISKGDYFTQTVQEFTSNFEPHAPSTDIVTKVISIYGGVNQAGQNAIITLNKGKRDGVENGHVLALYQKGELLKGRSLFKSDDINLPNVRYGLIFVFRTFQKVSYALVLQTRLPVQLLDTAQTP